MKAGDEARDVGVMLEPGGLFVPLGARVAHLFDRPAERCRFARFIAQGLRDGDKCIIVSDKTGAGEFCQELEKLGVDAAARLRDGALVLITDEVSVELIEPIARPILEDTVRRFRFVRCINDTSWMTSRGWSARDFVRFEVKGHLLIQNQPCTVICQYDTSRLDRRRLDEILAAHQFTVVGTRTQKNTDRRPLSQIIFDGMDEQLRVLTHLQSLSLRLAAALTLSETLDAIVGSAMTICGCDRVAINHIGEHGELVVTAHRGLSDQYVAKRRSLRDDPLIGAMVESRKPLIVDDIEEVASGSAGYESWKLEGIHSMVTLPLVSEGRVLGFIWAASGVPRHYTQTETDAMAILAAQACSAITSARLFEQLREANSAKDEFLATLSHELRTPLTPILGWMHILEPFKKDDPLLAKGLEAIERNTQMQAGLINDLLDLTRIMSRKFELKREPTSMVALVRVALDEFRPQAERRNIAIDINLPDEPVTADIDPVRLRQVMANLLANALKFTPDGGRISVSVRMSEADPAAEPPDDYGAPVSQVIVDVADTGIGIEPEFIDRIFERFTQAHSDVGRRYGGLGLGLAITKALVELHGGEVSGHSDGSGRGSRFTVRLPLSRAEGKQVREDFLVPEVPDSIVDPIGVRVLVIEDSLDTIEMMKLWLTTSGCTVFTAADAAEGLRLAREMRPELIISDIGMPETDGYQFIKQVRQTAGLEEIPAIALTGYAREEDRDLALEAGYNAHIAKPADMRNLLASIRMVTRRVAA